jgi:hypothetical protein
MTPWTLFLQYLGRHGRPHPPGLVKILFHLPNRLLHFPTFVLSSSPNPSHCPNKSCHRHHLELAKWKVGDVRILLVSFSLPARASPLPPVAAWTLVVQLDGEPINSHKCEGNDIVLG